MVVKILGTGCKRCTNLEEVVRNIVRENKIDAVVEKVTDIQEFVNYGILATPGLVINEKVVSFGAIPPNEKILEWLKQGN
ncbi:MAG: thioredoxin family protein [Melioribacter sp.]|nr:thioredoxin family protein [Melioribacter sp.]